MSMTMTQTPRTEPSFHNDDLTPIVWYYRTPIIRSLRFEIVFFVGTPSGRGVMNLVKLRWDLKTGETQGFGVDQELGLSGDSGNGVQLGHWMMTDRSGGCSIELVTGAV